jgi:hypothetical protein
MIDNLADTIIGCAMKVHSKMESNLTPKKEKVNSDSSFCSD